MHFDNPIPANVKSGAKNLNLNKLMQNVGAESFDYGTFKASYDTDPRIKAMIKDFNKIGITPKTKNELEDPSSSGQTDTDKVGQMAKRAVDLKDL